MQRAVQAIREDFEAHLQMAKNSADLEELKVRFLGRKGPIQELMQGLKDVSKEERPLVGKQINDLKEAIASAISRKETLFLAVEEEKKLSEEEIDITLPGRRRFVGRKHIITQALDQFIEIFAEMGFTVQYGPIIDTDWYNFGALNIPEHHPARSMQDTFYLDPEYLLRTHNTNIQGHLMERADPPIRVIAPGKTFRNEEISARSHVFFHQIDGFYVDKNVSMADLIGTFDTFLKRLFGGDVAVRYRPSYFPFVEPGLEIDVACIRCKGEGCSICKRTGWLEIAGAGMMHPEVLRNGGIDPEVYTGFAWGMGVERLVLLQHGIPDIRMFVENDMRLLKQFSGV